MADTIVDRVMDMAITIGLFASQAGIALTMG